MTNKTAAWSADLRGEHTCGGIKTPTGMAVEGGANGGNSEPQVSAIGGANPLGEHRHEQNSPRVLAFRPLLRRSRGATGGQVVVELLLILPVFMLMLFFIMELGNLAYQTILVNHSAYELARIGSLIAGPSQGGGGGRALEGPLRHSLCEMYKNCAAIKMLHQREFTCYDRQAKVQNEDLLVTLVFPARLVFPGSSYFLSDLPLGSNTGIRTITVKVRMPIEKPFFQ